MVSPLNIYTDRASLCPALVEALRPYAGDNVGRSGHLLFPLPLHTHYIHTASIPSYISFTNPPHMSLDSSPLFLFYRSHMSHIIFKIVIIYTFSSSPKGDFFVARTFPSFPFFHTYTLFCRLQYAKVLFRYMHNYIHPIPLFHIPLSLSVSFLILDMIFTPFLNFNSQFMHNYVFIPISVLLPFIKVPPLAIPVSFSSCCENPVEGVFASRNIFTLINSRTTCLECLKTCFTGAEEHCRAWHESALPRSLSSPSVPLPTPPNPSHALSTL